MGIRSLRSNLIARTQKILQALLLSSPVYHFALSLKRTLAIHLGKPTRTKTSFHPSQSHKLQLGLPSQTQPSKTGSHLFQHQHRTWGTESHSTPPRLASTDSSRVHTPLRFSQSPLDSQSHTHSQPRTRTQLRPLRTRLGPDSSESTRPTCLL
ncbi:hypothetical protein CFP56_030763 [Quercus suber]|uniref:Uncharacterized protein n=1 Tax=Quercus suber TaxID=58331 RepID=A0AAW0JMB2_QUESU